MIRIFCKPDLVELEITSFVKSVSDSGDSSTLARKLSITVARPIWDDNMPKVKIPKGTPIWMKLDDNEIFTGIVWTVQDSSNEELIITAYDYLIYLSKSNVTYNFNNIFPEDATKKICSELGVAAGEIAQTGIKVSNLIQKQKASEAILGMYDKVTPNGFLLTITNIKVNVIKKAQVVANYILTMNKNGDGNNVISNEFTTTLDNMINRVKIYDDKNNYVGYVSNDQWLSKYGVLQDNYTVEKNKNPYTEAKALLTDGEDTCTVEALGDWSCKTGYAIKTKIFYLDSMQDATFLIDGDTHTWEVETDKYTMQLNLVSY